MKATRRAAVTAYGAAALTLTGCTSHGAGASSDDVTPTASPSTAAGAGDPDSEALVRATALTRAMLAEARAAGRRADPGGRLTALHRAHLAALEAAGTTGAPAATPRASTGRPTPATLRRHEVRTQRELARLAEQARSGLVARLFASMSAGVAAHVAALPPAGTPG